MSSPKSVNVYRTASSSKVTLPALAPAPSPAPASSAADDKAISSNKNVQLSASPPASPLTPRSKISVICVTPAPVSPAKSKLNSSQPEPVWVTERSTFKPSSLNNTGTLREANTFMVNVLLSEKSTSPFNVSVLPPNTSPANFCIWPTVALVLMPELCELSITVTTPPPKSPNVYGAPAGSKSVAEKAESSPPSPPVPPEPIGVTISSNKKVQLSGSPPASPLTPRSKISVT